MQEPPRIKHDIISEREAWPLFKIAAISEAFSWMLLLLGILIKYLIPTDGSWLVFGGSVHGIVFLAYFAAVVGLWKILRFKPTMILIALAVSVVPFGTLVLEQYLERKRQLEATSLLRQVVARGIIIHSHKLLAIQPQDTSFWCLPGGTLLPHETPEAALVRAVTAQTGITPVVGELRTVFQYHHHAMERLELFFAITNTADYTKNIQPSFDLEEVKFIPLDGTFDLKPAFLLEKDVRQKLNSSGAQPVYYRSNL